jgi:hypothetical protein
VDVVIGILAVIGLITVIVVAMGTLAFVTGLIEGLRGKTIWGKPLPTKETE